MKEPEQYSSPSKPYTVAKELVMLWDEVVPDWRAMWWSGNPQSQSLATIRAQVYLELEDAVYPDGTDELGYPAFSPWQPNKAKVDDVLDAIASLLHPIKMPFHD